MASSQRKWYQIDVQMIAAKVAFILVNGKESCYLPYMVLFFTSIGLSPSQAGIINGVRFVGSIIGAPLWGMLADHKNAHLKVMLAISIAATLLQAMQPLVALCLNRWYDDNNLLFYTFLALNILAMFFDSNLTSFVDAAVFEVIQASPNKPDFGFQRLFGCVGFGAATMISSVIIDALPKFDKFSSYSPVFFIYAVFVIGLCISMVVVRRALPKRDQSPMEPRKDTKAQILAEMKKSSNIFFFATLLCFGITNGFYISYFSVLLKELNGAGLLVGLCVATGAVSSIIVLLFATAIIRQCKTTWAVLTICMFSWVLRFLGFYFIKNAWLMLPLQILHGFGFALTIVGYITHVKEVSPPEILTSMCSVANMLFFFAGNFTANVCGGVLSEKFRTQDIFLALSLLCLAWCALLIVYARCAQTKKSIDIVVFNNNVIESQSSTVTLSGPNCLENKQVAENKVAETA